MSEDIKVGETYYVRVKVLHKNEAIIGCATVDNEGKNLVEFMAKEGPAFVPIPQPAPKYDPCRPFKRGDIVEVRIRDGRIPWGSLSSGCRIKLDEKRHYVVSTDESRNNVRIDPIIDITEIAHTNITVDVLYLELVTPVEEKERYRVTEDYWNWIVIHDRGKTLATVSKFSKENCPNAKAAAEAECARLNEEWRKEQQ